jgi:DNA-binding NtrC family response regulator
MTVFVVDDEALIADTLAVILQGGGVAVRAFHNGQDALKAAAKELPDFLISDVVMPKMNGYELAAELMRRVPACQVLLMSGNAAVLQDSPRMDFEVLQKPVSPKTLIQRVRAAQNKC